MYEHSATLPTSNTMQPKVVLVVSRTHWRCLTCKLLNRRVVSIDQHLKSIHPGLGLSPTAPLESSFDRCCHSDGELETAFQYSDVVHAGKSSEAGIKKEEASQNVLQLQRDLSEPSSRHRLRNMKRKASGKSSQSTVKRRRINSAKQVYSAGGDPDEDCLPSKDTSGEDESRPEEEQKKDKSSTRSRVSPRQKLDCSQAHQNVNKMESKQGKQATKKVAVSKLLNRNSLPSKVPASGGRGRKSKQSTKIKNEDVSEDPLPVVVKEEFSVTHSDTKTLSEKGEKPVKIRQLRKPRKSNSNNALDKLPRQVDKSNIATSCVPWLLDSGRKAGDKVNKKPRRTLLPDEKQAVRELYGISLFEQLPDTPAVSLPGGGSQRVAMESQPINVGGSFTSHHPDLMAPVQRTAREEDPVQRNYAINMFSPGTRDFFVDSTRTQDNMYPGYSGLFPQHQHPHYTHQAPEFYTPAPNNNPPQTSAVMNFQGYTQTPLPILSTPDPLRHQMDGTGYLGQDFSITSLPQPHGGVPAASNPAPRPASHSTQPSARASYGMSHADPVQASQPPPATSSVPESQHREEALDSNPDNQCRVCEEKFQSSEEHGKHQKEFGRFSAVECKRCRRKFHGIHELNLHVFSVHETEKGGFCFICNQNTTGLETLERHVHSHAYNCERQLVDMRFHDCRLCCEELHSSYTTLRTHYYQHHVAHVCSDCFLAFKDVQAYKDHCRTHEGRPIFCSICGSKFESVDSLDQHTPCSEDIWAEDGKGDQCFKCGLWCPNRAVVEAHRKQHRSQEDVEAYRQGAKVGFPCVLCEKVFKNKHACRRHIKMVHEGVSCYKHHCEHCGKGFLTKGHMRDHIALHHLKIKRYSCDYCDQQFVCGPTLRRHVRKEHTKHKPYQCQHCGERFFEKTPLQRHLTVHTGLAPFMCEHCGKGFYTKHSFTNHGSTHSTVKEFVCGGCQKGFTRKYNLQAHSKICKML